MRINFTPQYQSPSFTSYRDREAALEAAKRAAEIAARELSKLQQHVSACLKYNLSDPVHSRNTMNLLGLIAETSLSSIHSIEEFVAPEEVAAGLRSKLSRECQEISLQMRKEIQEMPVVKDPVLALVYADKLKGCLSSASDASGTELDKITQGAKTFFVQVIENADLSKFDEQSRRLIVRLAGIIKASKGADFGAEYPKLLQELVDGQNQPPIIASGYQPAQDLRQQVFIPQVQTGMKK